MIFTIFTVSTVNKNDRSFFGMRFYIVKTDSMSLSDKNKDLDVHFDSGDIIIVEELEETTILQPGDIITFVSQDSESFGQVITHKIREKTVDAYGNAGFITYGTTTGVDDQTVVTYLYILGKYESKIPQMGTFFNFLKTPQGYIVCIFVPFILLILNQGVNTVKLFRRYKGEQMEEMNAEKARIEAERAENARMMEELMALKAQLESKTQESLPEGEDANADS